MSTVELEGILAHAIAKEEEAMRWYLALAEHVEQRAIAAELRRIAEMERAHRDRLRSIGARGLRAGLTRGPLPDLRIAEYLPREPAEVAVHPAMTWEQVVRLAMRRELAAQRLYTDLGNLALDPAIKELFLGLAREEQAHKFYFESLWDEHVSTRGAAG